jgi:hypothetical protein
LVIPVSKYYVLYSWPTPQGVPGLHISPYKSFFLSIFLGTLNVVEFLSCETLHGHVKSHIPPKLSLFQEPIKCKAPGNPENGHSFGKIYTVGAEVTFTCEEGHQLIGVTKITCLESGEWSHLRPYCEGTLSKFSCLIMLSNLRKVTCRHVNCYVFFVFETQVLGWCLNEQQKTNTKSKSRP